jgi:hypothetical protein
MRGNQSGQPMYHPGARIPIRARRNPIKQENCAMSVIAKMNVGSVREFGASSLIKLSCIYEHDGLNGEGYEDRRFTKATPWGEGDLTTPHNCFHEAPPTQSLYLLFVAKPKDPSFDADPMGGGALLMMPVMVKRFIEWGASRQVEIVLDREAEHEPNSALNLRLAIDNPGAHEQFAEGQRFQLLVYDAGDVSLALAASGA